jgi:hypothetical protein
MHRLWQRYGVRLETVVGPFMFLKQGNVRMAKIDKPFALIPKGKP